MRIKNLSIANFRNIDLINISFNKNSIIYFIGENGQGKTNILESIYLLLTGRSFRCSQIEYFRQKNKENPSPILLKTLINNTSVEHLLEFQSHFTKYSKIDGKKTSYSNLMRKFSAVIFSPESLFVIKQGPEVRRDFLDELSLFFFPENMDILLKFTKTLKTRNKVLKDIKENTISYEKGIKLIESLNPSFLELSTSVIDMRVKTIEGIEPFIKSALDHIFQTEDVNFSLEYSMTHQVLNKANRENIFSLLNTRMSELNDIELKIGTSLVGPHKHDINFIYEGKNARFYCSQGQQKALMLAVKIGQVLYYNSFTNNWPILLLDDVLSELDRQKSSYLLEFLKLHNIQTFITSTEFINEFNKLDIQLYAVNDGKVQNILI